jgi:hypothetical protein
LSLRNDNPTGRGILFDTAAVVLGSTRELKRGEAGVKGLSRRKREYFAPTLWVILVHPNGAFFVTCNNRQLLVGKEKVGGGYADLLRILR